MDELLNHIAVVDNLMKDIKWRTVFLERPLDSCHRHLHSGAKAARLGQDNFFDRHRQLQSGGLAMPCQSQHGSGFAKSVVELG